MVTRQLSEKYGVSLFQAFNKMRDYKNRKDAATKCLYQRLAGNVERNQRSALGTFKKHADNQENELEMLLSECVDNRTKNVIMDYFRVRKDFKDGSIG